MSVPSELRRRVRAEQSLPRYEPCLPRPAKQPPAGPGWIHEIKHDGFRIIAYRSGGRVQLMTRAENNFASRFPLITAAIAALPVRSCVVDGEAIACDDNGLAVFELIRYHRRPSSHRYQRRPISLCAFDLLELNGRDMRSAAIEERKGALADLLRSPHGGIAFNENFSGDGATIYEHACGLGCEGIVSKRLGSPYHAGRSPHWIKVKNPKAPAVKRENEVDWS
jgi:bifunctional non-homologous end joining protein LigD